MSIFDDNDNSLAKFNQLVQLAKNVASFQDTTQEDWRIQQQLYQQETRKQNQLKSRHNGIVNAFNNATTKEQLEAVGSNYSNFMKDAKIAGVSDLYLDTGNIINNKYVIFNETENAVFSGKKYLNEKNQDSMSYESNFYKDNEGNPVTFTGNIGDIIGGMSPGDLSQYISETENQLQILQAAKQFNYFNPELGKATEAVKERLNALNSSEFLQTTNISDFLTFDPYDETVSGAQADDESGQPSNPMALQYYNQIKTHIQAGSSPKVIQGLVSGWSSDASSKYWKEIKKIESANKGIEIANQLNAGQLDSQSELINQYYLDNPFISQSLNKTGKTITDASFFEEIKARAISNAMKYNNQYKLASGQFLETNPIYDPSGEETTGTSQLGISKQDLMSAQRVFDSKQDKSAAITDEAWNFVLKENNLSKEEYKKYQNKEIIMYKSKPVGADKFITTKLDPESDLAKSAQLYVNQNTIPHPDDVKTQGFQKYYNYYLEQKYPKDKGWYEENGVLMNDNLKQKVDLKTTNFKLGSVIPETFAFEGKNVQTEFIEAKNINDSFFANFKQSYPDAKVPVKLLNQYNQELGLSSEQLSNDFQNFYQAESGLESYYKENPDVQRTTYEDDFITRALAGEIENLSQDKIDGFVQKYQNDIENNNVGSEGISNGWKWALGAAGTGAGAAYALNEDNIVKTTYHAVKQGAVYLKDVHKLSGDQIDRLINSNYHGQVTEKINKYKTELENLKNKIQPGTEQYKKAKDNLTKLIKTTKERYVKHWTKELKVSEKRMFEIINNESKWNPFEVKRYITKEFPKNAKKLFSAKPGKLLKTGKILGTFQIGRYLTEGLGYDDEFSKTLGGATTVVGAKTLESIAGSKTTKDLIGNIQDKIKTNKKIKFIDKSGFPSTIDASDGKIKTALNKALQIAKSPSPVQKKIGLLTTIATGIGLGINELLNLFEK